MDAKDQVETIWNPVPQRLRIRQYVSRQVVNIEGIKYSFHLFRGFGTGKCSIALNQPFEVVKRKDGVITIKKIKNG